MDKFGFSEPFDQEQPNYNPPASDDPFGFSEPEDDLSLPMTSTREPREPHGVTRSFGDDYTPPDDYTSPMGAIPMGEEGKYGWGFSDEDQQADKFGDRFGFSEPEAIPASAIPVAKKPSFFEHIKQLPSDIMGGLIDYTEMVPRELRALPGGPKAGQDKEGLMGRMVTGIEKYKETHPQYKMPESKGIWGAIHGGLRAAATSMAAGLPGMAAGAATGAALGGGVFSPVTAFIGGVLGYATSGALQFGLSQYDSAMEEALDAGKSMKQAESYALKTSIYEGVFEFGADLLEGATFKLGSIFTAPVKNIVKASLRDLFTHNLKNAVKRTAMIAAIETPSEMLTGGMQAEAAHDINLGDMRFWDAAKQAFGPAFVASLIFGGIGAAGVYKYKKGVKAALTDPSKSFEERMTAIKTISEVIKPYSPEAANAWDIVGFDAVAQNKPIDLDMKFDRESDQDYKVAEEKLRQTRLQLNVPEQKVTKEQRQEFINEDFKGKTPVAKEDTQQFIAVGGPAGAGKSTSIDNIMKDNKLDIDTFVIINPDAYKERAGYTGDRATLFHAESSQMAREALKRAVDQGYNVLYDSQMRNFDVVSDAADTVINNGGNVGISFTDTDYVTSRANTEIRRVSGREDRYVPDTAIVNGINGGVPTLIELVRKYVDNPAVMFNIESNNVEFGNPVPIVVNDRIVNQEMLHRLMSTPYDSILTPEGGIKYERSITGGRINTETIQQASEEVESRVNARRVVKGTKESRAVGKLLARRTTDTLEDYVAKIIDEKHGGIFVSPNVAEPVEGESRVDSLEKALKYIKSTGQASFASIMKDIGKRVDVTVKTFPALGTWGQTVENSLFAVIPHVNSFDKLRYMAAAQGLIGRQKAVIAFMMDRDGDQRLYEVDTGSTDIREVHATFDEIGIESHTFALNNDGTVKALVYDYAGTEIENIQEVGKRYGKEIKIHKGQGEYLASPEETRPQSAKFFREITDRYEEESEYGLGRFRKWERTAHISPPILPVSLNNNVRYLKTTPGEGEIPPMYQFCDVSSGMGFSIPYMLKGKELNKAIKDELDKINEKVDKISVTAFDLKPKISPPTPAFKAWFGDSKIGTPNNPEMLFHGTFETFDTFIWGDLGFHFGTAEQAMDRIRGKRQNLPANTWEEMVNRKDTYMPVYLKMENPLEMDDCNWDDFSRVYEEVRDVLRRKGEFFTEADADLLYNIFYRGSTAGKNAMQSSDVKVKNEAETEGLNALRQALQNIGYDGIKYINRYEGYRETGVKNIPEFLKHKTRPDYSYIVFDANQVKSVYNHGSFSDSKNIYLQVQHKSEQEILNRMRAGELNPSETLTAYLRGIEETNHIYKTMQSCFNRVLDKETRDRVTLELQDVINLSDTTINVGRSLQDHGITEAELKDYDIAGLTSISMPNLGASIQIAYDTNAGIVAKTTYHECFHLTSAWLLPENDRNFLLRTYGNEEATADAFAAYARSHPDFKAPNSRIEAIFRTLKRYLDYVYHYLQGHGFNRPEDIFGTILTHGYRMQPDSIIKARMLENLDTALDIKATQTINDREWIESPESAASKPPLDDDLSPRIFYNGIQKGFGSMPDHYMFIDKLVSGSTFLVPMVSGQEVNNLIRKKLESLSKQAATFTKPDINKILDTIHKTTGKLSISKKEEQNRLQAETDAARVKRANQDTPIVALDGTPYKTKSAAMLARSNLTKQYGHDYDVIEHQGGYALQRVVDYQDPISKDAAIREAARTQDKINIATGVQKIGQLIVEGETLDIAMAKAEKESAHAEKIGKAEGKEVEKEKTKKAKEKAKIKKAALKEIRDMIDDLKKAGKKVDRMPRNQAKAVRELLADIDLKKPTKKTLSRLNNTRKFLEDNPEYSTMPPHVIEELRRLELKAFRDLDIDDMRLIHDAILHHIHLASTINRIKVNQKNRTFTETVSDILGSLKPSKEIHSELMAQTEKPTPYKNLWDSITYLFGLAQEHYDFIIEKVAGINSTFHYVFYKDVKRGDDKRVEHEYATWDLLKQRLKENGFDPAKVGGDVSAWMNERITTAGFELTRGHRMALYRHWLNADNHRSLTDIAGGFTLPTNKDPNKIYNMTEGQLEEIIGDLSEQERIFAGDAVTKLFEEQGKAMAEVFYKLNGYELKLVDYYYPKQVAPLARGLDISQEEARKEFERKYLRVGVPKGMTKERQGVIVPIKLNSLPYDINKSVMQASAYINLEIPISNAARILFDKGKVDKKTNKRTLGFRQEFINRYGEKMFKEIEKGLRDISGEWESYTIVEEGLMKMKNHLSTAILGLNPFVMLKQLMSFPLYLPYVNFNHLSQGLMDAIVNPTQTNNEIKVFSPEYRRRVEGGFSRDVMDIFKTGMVKQMYGGKASIPERVMGGIKMFDQAAVMSGMRGARNQVLAEFEQGKLSKEVKEGLDLTDADIPNLTPEEKMKYAYEYGDYVTERSQPMFSPEHRSALSRGGPWVQLFTMFGSFTNQAYNLIRRSVAECSRTGSKESYSKLAKVLFLLLVVNTLGIMAIDWLRDELYQRKKQYRRSLWRGVLDNWAGYMFFVRDLEKAISSKIEKGPWYGYDVSLPINKVPELFVGAVSSGVGALIDKSAGQRKKKALRFVDDSLSLWAMSKGIPYQTPKNLVQSGYKGFKKIERRKKMQDILRGKRKQVAPTDKFGFSEPVFMESQQPAQRQPARGTPETEDRFGFSEPR